MHRMRKRIITSPAREGCRDQVEIVDQAGAETRAGPCRFSGARRAEDKSGFRFVCSSLQMKQQSIAFIMLRLR